MKRYSLLGKEVSDLIDVQVKKLSSVSQHAIEQCIHKMHNDPVFRRKFPFTGVEIRQITQRLL